MKLTRVYLRSQGITEEPVLVQESEWMRVYRVGKDHYIHESKFLEDGLQISADHLKKVWPTLTEESKLEFANAYSVKPKLSPEDTEILNFLMVAGDEPVWSALALLLTKHTDRQRVLRFLIDRVDKAEGSRANYYQALQRVGDATTVPTLRAAYEKYRTEIDSFRAPDKSRDILRYMDYLRCCATLYALDGSQEYRLAINQMLNHSDERVRDFARQILPGQPSPE